MTTTVKITNKANSNGDVHVRGVHTSMNGSSRVPPGQSTEFGITDSSVLTVFETMPDSAGLNATERNALYSGEHADALIAAEVARQDKMWGVANERTDSSSGQLLNAGVSQALALVGERSGNADAFTAPPSLYPEDWSGFRTYGSEVANIVVAIAFLRQEAKRLIASGADTTRTSRNPQTQPYTGDQPTEYTK